MFGDLRKEVDKTISKVCKMEGVTIIKAATLPDHVHMYMSIPPKESVAKVVDGLRERIAGCFSTDIRSTGTGITATFGREGIIARQSAM